jgi:hypothetical protein
MVDHWTGRRGDPNKNFQVYAKENIRRYVVPRVKESLDFLRKQTSIDSDDSLLAFGAIYTFLSNIS